MGLYCIQKLQLDETTSNVLEQKMGISYRNNLSDYWEFKKIMHTCKSVLILLLRT